MLIFEFLQKSLRIVSPPHIMLNSSRKTFLNYILLTYQVYMFDCFEKYLRKILCKISGHMCVAIVSFSGCDFMNFETNVIFLMKPFFYMTKKSRQKLKYLENKEDLQAEVKSIFHHFQWTFSCQTSSHT